MARVAVVTGGTRGIGAAISIALQEEGHRVAAVYARDDAAAEAFHKESGVAVYKWDVGDHQACLDGCALRQAINDSHDQAAGYPTDS